MLDKLSEGIAVEGMESLAPALVDKMIPVLETVPEGARIVLVEPERICQRAESLIQTTEEFLTAAWSAAAAGAEVPIQASDANFATVAETRRLARSRGQAWWELGGISAQAPGVGMGSEANAGSETNAALSLIHI